MLAGQPAIVGPGPRPPKNFCAQDKTFTPKTMQRIPEYNLGAPIRIPVGSVKIIDPAFIRRAYQIDRFPALRQIVAGYPTPEPDFAYHQSVFAQFSIFHTSTAPF
jgi:hypothetical protein